MESIAMKFRPEPGVNPQFRLIVTKCICILPEQTLGEIFHFDFTTVGSRQGDRLFKVFGSHRMGNTQRQVVRG